ncbi:hypothetical protein [Candidatus Ornithobacterium hominis]|uniref:hypothetical protein n=1 Tax=Candidatus Ornithobacterium hominis TaxID=2497989 RepID=UPI001058B691|nr:hypothetical protein [Candidatus Ornithobacterium hominis]
MKNKSLSPFLFFLILAMCGYSCKTNAVTSNDFLPEIKNAFIESYNTEGERGYTVSFEVENSFFQPVGVVAYKVKQDLTADDVTGQLYQTNVIHESRRIQNFKPQVFNQENGVLFLVDSTYFLKKVNFKKK